MPDDNPTAARRVWRDGDPEPGPEVTHVRDREGDRWQRDIETDHWRCYGGDGFSARWPVVLCYGPIIDDTPVGATEPAPTLDLAADTPTPDAPWVPRIGETVLVRCTLIHIEDDYEGPFRVEIPSLGSNAAVWVPAVERAQ